MDDPTFATIRLLRVAAEKRRLALGLRNLRTRPSGGVSWCVPCHGVLAVIRQAGQDFDADVGAVCR